MKRGVRRAPSRKRKLGGRAKEDREPTAVNSFCRVASLPYVWAFLRLREMVRSGSRPGQVLPSGRHTGPAKLTNGKKGTHLRKISRFDEDSGNPIHSDFESRTETIQGLDGCASLLWDILRNEDSGSETAHSENRHNPRPLERKRYGSKKKGHEKHTVPLVIQEEIVSSDNKKQIHNEASAGSERDTSDIAQNWPLQDHYRMYSPIIYQALCEHVQTQMSLMNNLASKNSPNGIPAVPCQFMSGSESQATPHSSSDLCTSTPVWSPQPPPCPPMVHSSHGKETHPDESSKTHQSPTRSLPAFLATNEEKCAREQIGEATSEGKDLNVHVRDAKIVKDIQKAKNLNQTTEKVRTLKYLLGELKALVAEQEDSEIQRLITEVEACVSMLPAVSVSTDIEVEIALAMQPLRSENAQLRRQLRILNQKLREQEKTHKASGTMECNLELFSLQSLNISLQNQLQESLKSQEYNQKSRHSMFKMRALEARTLQKSMAKLLSDLSMESTRSKPGNNLTKSLLNIYDKQLQQDPSPAHTSIMSYLNKLETNHSFTHSVPLSIIKNEETMEPDRPYEDVLPSKGPQHSNTKDMEEVSTPGIISTLSKPGFDESETMTLIGDECNLDNTIYIPFARSTSKKKSPLSKRISPQPQINVAATQLVSNSGLFVSEKENKLCAPVVCSSKKEAEDAPEKLSRTADMEDIQLLKKIKEAIGKIPAATEDPEEQAVCHSLAACHSSSIQVKGNTVSDGSFLNSDLMSDWSISSFSTFTSRDEQDFRNGLAALDANIARLQKALRTGLLEK
ncbi:PREDICTED: coiled-coil domain-containing protein 14 [Galeopterus variegatus]|uniref:Coiled-coil domain-containing protein 14 n=1 Tax=Galeopterus variegatus TaxID=482537 RepID=A0ABM0QID5_GALVR|nr:PREDICTED: coiled-coil domain-containing protein 14 [Galeopterus variegatus]